MEQLTSMSIPNDDLYYDFDFCEYDLAKVKSFPAEGTGLNQYLDLLPITSLSCSLGEGNTPLTKAETLGNEIGISNLFIKHEELNPTGCFKDRESAVAISKAIEDGVAEVYVASSGNAALSTAAYAQKAGLKCTCYIPRHTSEAKKQLIKLFGAELIEIDGVYEDVYRQVKDLKRPGLNVTPGANQYRIEGNKTVAYEIWQQLGVPDVVVIPCGNGGNLAGAWRGFWELKELGLTKKIPQMIGVQVENAAPLKIALEQGIPYAIGKNAPDSIAEGIIAEESYCSPKAIDALTSSNGYIVEVSESEIKAALFQVIKTESLVPEPTSAAAFAALPYIQKKIASNAQVVVINTGSGMKQISEILELAT